MYIHNSFGIYPQGDWKGTEATIIQVKKKIMEVFKIEKKDIEVEKAYSGSIYISIWKGNNWWELVEFLTTIEVFKMKLI